MSLLAAHEHFENLGPFEWAAVAAAGVVSAWVIWKAVVYTLHPGEEDPGHIKRMILDDGPAAGSPIPPAPSTPTQGKG